MGSGFFTAMAMTVLCECSYGVKNYVIVSSASFLAMAIEAA